MKPREWIDCPAGRDGVELLQAAFEQHVYERHIHDSYAIGVTLRGVQRFWCRGATHDGTPGHVIVINPGEVHDGRSGAAGGYAYRMFYVRTDVVETLLGDEFGRATFFGVRHPLLFDPSLARQLDAAWNVMASSPTSLAADEWLLRILSRLATRHTGQQRTLRASRHERVLRQIRDYMRERVERAITVRELSAIASLSRFQLTRLFQQAYGLPLHAYQLHLRLEEAKRRLRSGQSITAVAIDLGFVDQSHFHRRFKGSFGMTPGQWCAAHGYKTRGRMPAYRDHDETDGTARRGCQTV